MEQMKDVKGVRGMAPFSINPMMLTHGEATATGVLLKGVDPQASLGIGAAPGATPPVLDLPKQIVKGSLEGLRLAPGVAQHHLFIRTGRQVLDLFRGLFHDRALHVVECNAGTRRWF